MSGFAGELCLKGVRDPAHLGRMDSALFSWGADAEGAWAEGPIGLVARLRVDTPWNATETQPLVDDNLVVVAHARLDDRAELGRTLDVPPDELDVTPDSRLIARAWKRWGDGCADHLLGDWVCAIWDRATGTLWLGRDAAGNTSLFFWHDTRRVVFSTSLHALFAHPEVPKQPNADHIARQLIVLVDPDLSNSTAYQDIVTLPGGYAAQCRPDGVTVAPWWHPDRLTPLENADDEELYGEFRRTYAAAVADRLPKTGGATGIMLSGGLDSGTVAALAAPRVAAQGERLLAFTAVPRFGSDGAGARRVGDEGHLAHATAAHVGHTDVVTVDSRDCGLVASLEQMLATHARPLHAAGNYHWIHGVLREADAQGVRVLLTGQGGNGTVSWKGTGGWRPGVRKIRRIIARLSPRVPWARESAIHPRFAETQHLRRRARTLRPETDDVTSARLGRLGSASLGATWMALGAAHGLDVRDPTRDRRVIECCWRLPNRLFYAEGLERGLIRKGMAGDLPPEVLLGRRRGLQSADLGYRILDDRAAVSAALDRIEHHPLCREWLDVTRMRAVLQDLARAVTPYNTRIANATLVRGLGIGLFLTRF